MRRALAGAAVMLSAWGLVAAPTSALPGDADAIAKASVLDKDPEDFIAVTAVCTRCHNSQQFLSTPRSASRWEELYGEMAKFGATGSIAQLNRVVHYFQKNLTVVNVNSSPPEEIAPTLQVDDAAMNAILARRDQRPFKDVADLAAIPGVDRTILETLKSRGQLQF
jgi:hypothetical protein